MTAKPTALTEMELQAWRKAGIELGEVILEESSENCADCRWSTLYLGEWYMVRGEVWKAARMETMGGCLCIGCLEERLGRALTPDDFTDAPVNDPALPNTSSRLRARLSGLKRALGARAPKELSEPAN